MTSINPSGISVGPDGQLRVSGFSSSIDWKAIVEAQVTARRAPAIQLETKLTRNDERIAAYGEVRVLTGSLASSLDRLRGAPGSSVDVFRSKVASGTTSATATAPAGHTPSPVNELLLTSIGPLAQNGAYSIRIQQLAAAQQIRSDAISSTTASLSSLGVTTGDFTLNGTTITVGANDNLQDLRAAINAAGAGVTASIISADATTNYLVLTSQETGTANELVFAGGGTGSSDTLGFTAAGAIKTELTQARNAILDVNGVTGIERSSNSIDDVVTGVTLNLLQAEADTTINLNIEPDLNAIKTAIGDFVSSYNEIRAYFTEQRTALDRNDDGVVGDGEFGVLAFDQRLRDLVSRMSEMAGTTISSNADGFRSLAQLGISMESDFTLKVDDATLDARLLNNVDEVRKLFAFNATAGDSRVTVLNRTSATQSGTYYLNLGGTDADGNVLSANLQTASGSGTGGADDGSARVTGQQVAGLTGGAQGLNLFFNGGPNLGAVNDVAITVSRGVADSFYDFFNDLARPAVGGFDTAVSELTLQNQDYNDRIQQVDDRLVFYRQSLEARFVRMETALAQLATLRSTIDSYLNAESND